VAAVAASIASDAKLLLPRMKRHWLSVVMMTSDALFLMIVRSAAPLTLATSELFLTDEGQIHQAKVNSRNDEQNDRFNERRGWAANEKHFVPDIDDCGDHDREPDIPGQQRISSNDFLHCNDSFSSHATIGAEHQAALRWINLKEMPREVIAGGSSNVIR
jgi:hypothetical protein